MNNVMYIFTFIGMMFILMAIILCLFELKKYIKDQIEMAKYRHKRKHRFDKPPTAKCYCKDCRSYEVNEGQSSCYCSAFGHYMDDDQFCSLAYPRKHDPEDTKNEEGEN